MSKKGPWRGGKVHVCADRCATCVFRPGNLMSLESGRVKDLLDSNIAEDSALTCHETLHEWGSDRPPAICRGFWDHPRSIESLAVRLAKALEADVVEYDTKEIPT